MWTRRQFGYAFGAVILAGGGTLVAAADEQKLQAAVARLETEDLFAMGGIGFTGITSPGELSFRILMAEALDRKIKLLDQVFTKGTPAAKGYALVGLYQAQPERFHELYPTLKDSPEKLDTMHGCIASSTTLGALAVEISTGAYKISANGRLVS